MTIFDGTDLKSLTLYLPSKPSLDAETPLWVELEEEESTQPLLAIGRDLTFKNKIEDDMIISFISEPMSSTQHTYHILDSTMSKLEQEELTKEVLFKNVEIVPRLENLKSVAIEIEPGRTLNVNPNLAPDELECLTILLKIHKGALCRNTRT